MIKKKKKIVRDLVNTMYGICDSFFTSALSVLSELPTLLSTSNVFKLPVCYQLGQPRLACVQLSHPGKATIARDAKTLIAVALLLRAINILLGFSLICIYIFFLNPAYGRHRISRPVRIVAQIPQ